MFLEFLAEPSTIFYPVFKELIETGLATSVYHMSGGAYKSKLAKPLAKHGLFVDMENKLFFPDWREIALKEATSTTTEAAYEKWPMNNEAFITTKNPIEAEKIISKYNLKPRFAGELEETNRTGIEFIAYSGEKIAFTWKK